MKFTDKELKRLKVIAFGIAKGDCEPDDLVGDALVYYFENYNRLKDHPNIMGYLVIKMVNLHKDHHRKKIGTATTTSKTGAKEKFEKFTPLDDYKGKEIEIDFFNMENKMFLTEVISIIKKMSLECSMILMLWREGYSMQEIANSVKINPSTAGTRLLYCRKKLYELCRA